MPIASRFAYLDHAAVGPLSQNAASAISNFVQQASELGDTVWPEWLSTTEKLRSGAAELLNCDESDLCLLPNTSTGINIVADGFPWQPGDNVVVPEGEFPSNLFPWQNQQPKGVEVRIVKRRDGLTVDVGDLIAATDASTRIISASWVGYATGFRIDLARLVAEAHSRGILVLLDAIQGLGVFPLDLSEIPVDFLAADGHKWLLGPEGAGIGMIRSEHLEKLRIGNVGWGSVKNSFNYAQPKLELRDTAARYEAGSANMVGLAGLQASLELFLLIHRLHGPTAIEKRVVALTTSLSEKLNSLGVTTSLASDFANRSGILNFSVPGVEPSQFRALAIDHDVVVSCRGGGVRVAVHAYNNEHDLDRLTEVVARFC